ncbi:transmembrane protein [Ceratobasidium sp. AG-Ba]|nr:transmembrane protein [Ceratobasidium sp. AG-Ba]
METSTSTIGVAIDLKHSEVAVRDLVTLVKQSDLITKDRIVINLQQFVEDAKSTGRNLQKFGSHVGTAVDQTVGMNEYTIGLLESAAKSKGSSTSSRALSSAPEAKEIKSMWFEAIANMKSNVAKLIVEAAANEQALNRLDGELSVINDMSAREGRRISSDKAETLNKLWTQLGGNKGHLAQFEHHSDLLKNVMDYRKVAADHVAGALFHLERLAIDLQDLNDQVTAPLLGKDTEVPLEVHIRTMQQGTARLLEARAREREREDGYTRKVLDSNKH